MTAQEAKVIGEAAVKILSGVVAVIGVIQSLRAGIPVDTIAKV